MAVYLDNNATTLLDEAVLQAMLPYMGQTAGNPSSVHRFGRLQKDAIEQARESVAKLAGASADQVIFTSGGTEANNLMLQGFCRNNVEGEQAAKRVAVSAIEHMSMLEPAQRLELPVDYIDCDVSGHITLAALEAVMTDQTALLSVMAANNETGVIQELTPLVELARERACYFHTDASQAAGKLALNFADSGVHAMTLSAHKLYGPVGVGALIVDKSLPIQALQYGGSQEKGLRPGTENVAAIVGFGKAAELAEDELQARQQHMRTLRDALEAGLNKFDNVTIFAQQAERLPNTVQFGVDGFNGETLLMQLDRKAIAVSSGSACTSGKTEPSHVLTAMKVPQVLADSAIRVSLGKNNSMSDVEKLLSALSDIIEVNRHSTVMMAASV